MNKDQYLAPISAMLEANGLSIDELADYQAATGGVRTAAAGPLLGGYIVKVDRGLSGNTGRSRLTHFNHLIDGVARECTCTCATCVADFSTSGTCTCECRKCAKTVAFPGHRELPISQRSTAEIDVAVLVQLVQQMAIKRAMHDNVVRARKSLAPKPTHGQGAREICSTALRHLFDRMEADKLITY